MSIQNFGEFQDQNLISNEDDSRFYVKWQKTWYRPHFKWERNPDYCIWKVYATKY